MPGTSISDVKSSTRLKEKSKASPKKGSNKGKSKLWSFPPREVAEEMTLLDASLLRLIKASELEDGAWMKKDKVSETGGLSSSLVVDCWSDLKKMFTTGTSTT